MDSDAPIKRQESKSKLNLRERYCPMKNGISLPCKGDFLVANRFLHKKLLYRHYWNPRQHLPRVRHTCRVPNPSPLPLPAPWEKGQLWNRGTTTLLLQLIKEQAGGTHHCNGGVELGNAHSAGRVLAVEAFIRKTAAVIGLHCRLRSVGIQVNEFLTWTDRQGDINKKNHARSWSSEKQRWDRKRRKNDDRASSRNPTEEPTF